MTTDKSPGAKLREEGQKWIERITAAEKFEKDWLNDALKAEKAYTNDPSTADVTGGQLYDYNILYANVETIVPAIINSPPAPDIRRRFGDQDEAARQVAEIYERTMRVQIDDSRLQIELENGAQDSFIAGRGLVRVRFESDIVGGDTTKGELEELDEAERGEDADGPSDAGVYDESNDGAVGEDAGGVLPDQGERVENERISFEAVSWRDFRHGPGKRWDQVPWVAFRFVISKDECGDKFSTTTIRSQLTDAEKTDPTGAEDEINGWEIWHRPSRKVIFVRDDGIILKKAEDPLGLSGFYPMGTPMQPVEINGRLRPVNPFAIYRSLADQLDTITKRIDKLLNQLKVKGWYPGDATDLDKVLSLDDNEFAPIGNVEMWAGHGGVDGVLAFWPIDRIIAVLKELYPAREATKQAIYEITGISDIVRGASEAQETATAQNIKNQWGSLRIQKMQRMIERHARDLFVIMSEIIQSKFTRRTLEKITSIPILPTPEDDPETQQKKQAVLQLLNERAGSFYRIDVESDSTVRADLTRQKAEVAEFLQGASAYFQAVAPLVQEGALPPDAAVDIFASTARMFNLGKSVEDTLERMVTEAKAKAQQPAPEKPDPEMVKAGLEEKKMQMQAQIAGSKAQSDQAASAAQIETIRAKLEADLSKIAADTRAREIDAQTKVAETNAKLAAGERTHQLEMQKGALELVKIQAEIEKIRAGTQATIDGAKAKAEAAKNTEKSDA